MKVQEMRTTIYNKEGKRTFYYKKTLTIPKMFCQILAIEKGEDLEPKLINFNKNDWKIEIIRKVKRRD